MTECPLPPKRYRNHARQDQLPELQRDHEHAGVDVRQGRALPQLQVAVPVSVSAAVGRTLAQLMRGEQPDLPLDAFEPAIAIASTQRAV